MTLRKPQVGVVHTVITFTAGTTVVIDEGLTVLLDISPPKLFVITIFGKLIFDRKDLTLDASYIMILGKNAALEVGTEDEPFLQTAVITLHGHPKSPEIPVYGAKMIALRDGRLDLHGKPVLPWTMLGEIDLDLTSRHNHREADLLSELHHLIL